jgi:integrase
MARPKAKAPARRYHISGQSVVTIAGRDIYLGPHDSPESIARYAVLIGIYQRNGLTIPDDFDPTELDTHAAGLLGQQSPAAPATDQTRLPILVRHITASYRDHARIRYRESPAELHRLNRLCDEIDQHDGDAIATEYGPLRLQRQRQRWIDAGISRVYCNRLTNNVKRIWRYAVSQELIESTNWEKLRSVEPLRIGQTEAPETDPVRPVNLEIVRATAKHLSPILKSMLRVQVATGMRPSEVCRMKPIEIDRTGEVWIYRPTRHKTQRKGKIREVPLIGDAREAVEDYLNRDPNTFCFSPAESMEWHLSVRSSKRKTAMSCGNKRGSNRKSNPDKKPGACFDHGSYRQAIHRAAKKAKVTTWNPYQVRHLTATMIRDAMGIEHAQAALGHSQPMMTQHYAKLSTAKAIEAAAAAPKL